MGQTDDIINVQASGLPSLAGRTMRYTLVGGVCAALNNLAIIAGALLGVHYVVSSIAAFVVVTPIGYALHSVFTFRAARTRMGFVRFTLGCATAFPAFIAFMAVLCSGFGIPVPIAAPVATVILYLWNYAFAHWAIVRRTS